MSKNGAGIVSRMMTIWDDARPLGMTTIGYDLARSSDGAGGRSIHLKRHEK
jgi:hypothetical protein